MGDCVFCRIVSGSIPAKVVYKGFNALAFLDINPLAKGHILVIPTSHVERLEELSADQVANYVSMVPRLLRAVHDAVGAQGTTIAWNNGKAAGQEVAHLHLHIVPRFDDDTAGPIHALFKDRRKATDAELDEVAGRIRKTLGM